MKSTLQEMIRAGLDFECMPKEINPAYTEKILSKSYNSRAYEVCALVPITQDYELSSDKIRSIPSYSEVHLINASNELFNGLVKLIPLLPDLVIPNLHYRDANRQTTSSKTAPVFLGVFVNRKVQVQTGSGAVHTGVLKHADSIGVYFEPEDNSSPLFITWHDIKKIIIPRDEKKG